MRDNEVDIFGNLIGFHLGGEIIERKEGTRGVVLTVDHGESCYPRYIAYKTIKSSIEPEKLENFVREAKQWFKVRGHPLILTPFYIQSFGNMPLICMPYCEMDLESYLEKQEQGKMNKIGSLILVLKL